jgi:hypothetical protein
MIWKYRIRLSLLLAGLFIVVGQPARARTLYVSPAGFDADNNLASISQPVASPKRALELAAAGDTILLRGGSYFTTSQLLANKPDLTIASYNGERATVFALYTQSPDTPESVFVITADRVTLLNLEIRGGSFYGVKVDPPDGKNSTNGVRILGCRISHTGRDCIKTLNADSLLIEECEIGPSGLRFPGNAEGIDSIGSIGVTIRRCYVHDTTTNGIYLKGGARNGLIEQCRVENTGDFGGILLGQDTDLEFMRDGAIHEAINCVARNNLVVNTGAAGMGTYSGSDVRFENNTLFNVAHHLQAGFWVVRNVREVRAQRVSFLKNILVMFSKRPVVMLSDLADQPAFDSNIYYNSLDQYEFRQEVITPPARVSIWNFVQWKQSLGVDGNTETINPLLDAGNQYQPAPNSPLVNRSNPPGLQAELYPCLPIRRIPIRR